jgi:hypothetical protein
MKEHHWFFFAWCLLASVSQAVVLDLARFEYHPFRDPFSLAKVVIQFGTFVGFAVLYRAVLGYFWKPELER